MGDEVKKSNQAEQGNQTESQKPENLDNRIPYEAPLLRKHGKVNDGTMTLYPAVDIDGFRDYTDFS